MTRLSGEVCADPDCTTPVGVSSKSGLCKRHHGLWRRRMGLTKCVEPGCEARNDPGHSTCAEHWAEAIAARERRAVDRRVKAAEPKPPCSASDCERLAHTRGMCRSHYRVALMNGLELVRQPQPETCTVDGCDRSADSRGWCHAHYGRWSRHGDVSRVFEAPPECHRCGERKARGPRGVLACPRCNRENVRRWEHENRDKVSAWNKQHRAKHRERYAAKYQAQMLEPGRREAARLRSLDWQRANRERQRASVRAWAAANPDRAAAIRHRRRGRKANAICRHGVGCVSRTILAALHTQPCHYCGAPSEHADHYIPLAKGGLHCRRNLLPACAKCNLSKNASIPVGWPGRLLNGYGGDA